jgi:hypothetical protein
MATGTDRHGCPDAHISIPAETSPRPTLGSTKRTEGAGSHFLNLYGSGKQKTILQPYFVDCTRRLIRAVDDTIGPVATRRFAAVPAAAVAPAKMPLLPVAPLVRAKLSVGTYFQKTFQRDHHRPRQSRRRGIVQSYRDLSHRPLEQCKGTREDGAQSIGRRSGKERCTAFEYRGRKSCPRSRTGPSARLCGG